MATARDIKQHLGRARVAVRSSELFKALESLVKSLELYGRSRLMGQEKYEVAGLMNEVLHGFGALPAIKKLFPKGLLFKAEEAPDLLAKLKRLQAHIQEAIEKAEYEKTLARMQDIDVQLNAARKLLERNEPTVARKGLRQLMHKYEDEPGLALYIGNLLLQSGQPADAEHYFRLAQEQDPKNSTPYAQLVTVLERLGQWLQAEEAVTTIMRRFGAGEHEYARLAGILLKQGRNSEALEAAENALKKNPDNRKAADIKARLSA